MSTLGVEMAADNARRCASTVGICREKFRATTSWMAGGGQRDSVVHRTILLILSLATAVLVTWVVWTRAGDYYLPP